MIAADRHARKSTSGPLPIHRAGTSSARVPQRADQASIIPRSRSTLVSDLVCAVVLLALAAAVAIPLVWGLALHQTPLAVSAGCAELLCAIVVLNRIFAPASTRGHLVPFLSALEERPWIMVLCLGLALTSALILITSWPG
jgi:hypothetical protein